MQWSSSDEVSVEHAPSLEELAGATQLVHDPDSWEEDDQEDEESQADVHSEVQLDHIPLDLGPNTEKVDRAAVDRGPAADVENETRAVEECSLGTADEDAGQPSEQMPFDQLPHLSPEPLHPKKISTTSKFKERQAALDPAPQVATLFDVHPLLEFARTHFNLTAPSFSFPQTGRVRPHQAPGMG